MWGKKAKSANVANAPVEAESKKQTKEEVKSRIAEYQESIETCEESIKTELKALKIAAGTVMGSGKLCLDTGTNPAVLKDMVCSPAGSTIKGVAALEHAGLRSACLSAIQSIMED